MSSRLRFVKVCTACSVEGEATDFDSVCLKKLPGSSLLASWVAATSMRTNCTVRLIPGAASNVNVVAVTMNAEGTTIFCPSRNTTVYAIAAPARTINRINPNPTLVSAASRRNRLPPISFVRITHLGSLTAIVWGILDYSTVRIWLNVLRKRPGDQFAFPFRKKHLPEKPCTPESPLVYNPRVSKDTSPTGLRRPGERAHSPRFVTISTEDQEDGKDCL